MATWDEVDAAALALPEVGSLRTANGWRSWRVRDKSFAWERPLGPKDRAGLDDVDGPILAVRVADLDAREVMIADDPEIYFTIPHFAGLPAMLVRLDRVPAAEVAGLLAEAWRLRATKTLRKQHPDL